MDFLQRLTLANWAFRVMVMLVGVTVIHTGYRISRVRNTTPFAGMGSGRNSRRMFSLRRVIGLFFAALGTVIIIAGLAWPIPMDWAHGVRQGTGIEVFDSMRSPSDSAMSRDAQR